MATEPGAQQKPQHHPAVLQRVDGAWIVDCPQCRDGQEADSAPTGVRAPLPDRQTAEQWADAHRAPGQGEEPRGHRSYLLSLRRELFVRWLMGNDPTEDFLDLSDLVKRPPWHRRAACRGMGHAVFVTNHAEEDAAALRVCAGCPVRQECLEHALDGRGLVGVWGGMTEVERKRLLRGTSSRAEQERGLCTQPTHS